MTAGINVEGSSTGATIANNISVDNGNSNTSFGQHGNIRVDATSITGTTLDYDLVFLHSSTTGNVLIQWNGKNYTTLSAFQAATGKETQGLQADPLWVAPAMPTLTFRKARPPLIRPMPALTANNFTTSWAGRAWMTRPSPTPAWESTHL